MANSKKVEWKVNTPQLIKETIDNAPAAHGAALRQPFQILKNILFEVGERASELNDPILNGLMCRLAIYEIADQYSKGYDKKILEKVMSDYETAKANK